jgi:hypothetical protein
MGSICHLQHIENNMGKDTLDSIVISHLMAESLDSLKNHAFNAFWSMNWKSLEKNRKVHRKNNRKGRWEI